MKQTQIIKKMCREELTQADVKVICKFRQFASPQSASPQIIETLLTSDVGLERALGDLTPKEVIMLHFLGEQQQPVDISAFVRISDQEGYRYGTFTQRYQGVLKDIKKRLIRKGLLVYYTDPSDVRRKSKMERVRLWLPVEFRAHLPGMISHPLKSGQSGILSQDPIHNLLADIGYLDEKHHGDSPVLAIDQNGCLRIRGAVLSLDSVAKWKLGLWKTKAAGNMGVASHGYSLDCLPALKVIFSSLNCDEWIRPDQLKPVLDIFCDFNKDPDINLVCRLGWQAGILKTAEIDGSTCYRLCDATDGHQEEAWEDSYITDQEKAAIDLKKIPLPMLIRLSEIARFRLESKKILAQADPVMMGRKLDEIRNTPWLFRLVNYLPEFKDLFQKLEKNRGKEIMHSNLLVARIKHIGLNASLEKAFSNEPVLFLPNGFIAFPKALEPEIEKVVIQQGFVVKRAKS